MKKKLSKNTRSKRQYFDSIFTAYKTDIKITWKTINETLSRNKNGCEVPSRFLNNDVELRLRFCDSLVASLLFSKHIHFRVRALFTPYVHVFSFLHFIFSALISNCS